MIQLPQIDGQSEIPLYRQVYEGLRDSILAGALKEGDRLPPTRDLAGQLGLNRATVSAAYALLEEDGLVSGQVGRGSFVQGRGSGTTQEISFATSRPAEELFPIEEVQKVTAEVMRRSAAEVLQLGSPLGYRPLRQYLMEEALAEGVFDPETDDLMITSGCQQAFDLIQKSLISEGGLLYAEEPIYPGLKNAFGRKLTADVTQPGIEAMLVTPSFRNPTGYTMSVAERREIAEQARVSRRLLIEVDIYSRLRYEGEALPTVRSMGAPTLLLRSFSKIAFPGLRVGWVIGPKAMIERLMTAKQWTDLHSDQLSQAILLEFARSGKLEAHLERVLEAGRMRLKTTLDTLEQVLPEGARYTRPQGGMNLWVTLPEGCDSAAVLEKARRAGVSYLPGRYFSVATPLNESLRLSFAGLSPARIVEGLRRLGPLFEDEARMASRYRDPRPEMAMV